MRLGLVCVAGGRGARFGGDKLAERIGDRTVLEMALAGLCRAFPDAPLVVVVPEPHLERWHAVLAPGFPSARLVPGGPRRQDSVRNGIESLDELGVEVAAVHDGARPVVHPADVKGVVWALGDAACTVLCGRVSDTVKRVDAHGVVVETLARTDLRLAQTPQVVRLAAIRRAWAQVADEEEFTDEASLMEAAGMPVRSVVAQHPNPKITTAEDLVLVRALVGADR
jgi:2-C-methyl-D-erythritol 4-phosphate cytidylyltransferase